MKTLRVCLAGAVMFVLCAGCFGNCITDFTDGLGCAMSGSSCSSSSPSYGYGALVEVAPAPAPIGLADGGVSDAEVWVPGIDASPPP